MNVPEVRLIDDEGNRIVTKEEALRLSEDTGLDLLIVSLDATPPVVRLVDYGKHKFEAEKKAREAKKKQHVVDIKEVKMTVRIDDHDYETKIKKATKFLDSGNKVKLTIRLKGREQQHKNLAYDLANRFVADLEEQGQPESRPRAEGRSNVTVTLAPNKQPSKKTSPKPSDAKAKDAGAKQKKSASPTAEAANPSSNAETAKAPETETESTETTTAE
jgi:translation initiation factor IF-3